MLTVEDIDWLRGMIDRDFATLEEQDKADKILDELIRTLPAAEGARERLFWMDSRAAFDTRNKEEDA